MDIGSNRLSISHRNRTVLRLALATSLGLAMAACTTMDGGSTATASASSVPGANFDHESWDGYLGGGDSSQYSGLTQINRSNVNQLEIAWEFPTGDGAPPLFNPVVAGGRMYVINGSGPLVALNPATGELGLPNAYVIR